MKKYVEIYKYIKDKIVTGSYKSNEKLPSKRSMADKMGTSIITVEKAYGMLIDEGYITSHQRSGYYVNQLDTIVEYNSAHWDVMIQHLPENTFIEKENDFEYDLWFKTIRKVLSDRQEQLFIKSPNKGCAVLRNTISDYLLRYRDMIADPRCIIIGSGAEQLYETVVKILGRELVYGIEDPSYEQIEAVYQASGVHICKLKMGKEGIESPILHTSPIDILHVTPFNSYPTGVTTSLSKRIEYLIWAESGHMIVEDDFNSEFFMPGQPIQSLYSLDHNQSVIYINTFSKSLSPSMRIGYMILPEKLLSIYEEKLGNFSCSVPVLDQYILAEFISSGNFERHLNRMRRKMKK